MLLTLRALASSCACGTTLRERPAAQVREALGALLLEVGEQPVAQVGDDLVALEHHRRAHLQGGGAEEHELGGVLPGR